MFYGFVITEAGNRLLAKMVAGQTLELSGVIMEKGTAASADAARKLTAPIDPGPAGTSTVPTVKDSTVNMTVEYRSDLNGGLAVGFWIGGFAIYAKDPDTRENVMVYYGSLGDAKQYVSAYTQGMAPDVRRYQVSITVTAGIEVALGYPAEAWMTAQDVEEYCTAAVIPQIYGQIAGEILTGRVYTPLADRNGEEIVTRDGAGISAYKKGAENEQDPGGAVSGNEAALLFQLIDSMRADYTRRFPQIYGQITGEILSGQVYTPLANRNGEEIVTRDGAGISAHKKGTENEQDPGGTVSGNEAALLFQLIDNMRADYTRRLQELTNAIMSGNLDTQLAGRNGAAITTRDSADISAVKIL